MAFPVFCFEVTFSSYFSDNIWPEFYKIAGWLEWQCRVFHIIKSTNKFKKKNMPFVLLKEMLLPPLCGEQLPLQPQNIPKSTCSGHSQATWLGTAVHGIFLDPSIKTPRNDCVCVCVWGCPIISAVYEILQTLIVPILMLSFNFGRFSSSCLLA